MLVHRFPLLLSYLHLGALWEPSAAHPSIVRRRSLLRKPRSTLFNTQGFFGSSVPRLAPRVVSRGSPLPLPSALSVRLRISSSETLLPPLLDLLIMVRLFVTDAIKRGSKAYYVNATTRPPKSVRKPKLNVHPVQFELAVPLPT